jgi:hypothetical protein
VGGGGAGGTPEGGTPMLRGLGGGHVPRLRGMLGFRGETMEGGGGVAAEDLGDCG